MSDNTVVGVSKVDVNDTDLTYSDEEFAKILKISLVSFRNHAKNGPPRDKVSNGTSLDVRLLPHFYFGVQRRWPAKDVHEFVSGRWGE